MDLRSTLRATRRHWWIVLVGVGLAAGGAVLTTAMTVPRHAASVRFFVTTPSQGITDSYQGGLFSQQRVKSYADLLTSERLARSVAAAEGSGLNATQVQRLITAHAVPDTVLLEATVTDTDTARAERIAQAVSAQFLLLVKELETPPGTGAPTVKVEVVAGPTIDPTPVAPQPARNAALGLLLGLVVGVGAAVLREVLDVSIKTAETLQQVADAAVLATVPFDSGAKKSPLVIDGDDAHSARAEAYRHLRTNLRFVDVDRPIRTIVVTSAVPDEGKSTTAVNLALSFASAGQRVLLVEADLRRPRVAEYLSLEGAVGLSNVLAGQADLDEVLQRWGAYDMHVLPSGFIPPNPSELLGSRNMALLLERLQDRYHMIILDTPPLLPVTDAAVLATMVDGTLLVTRSGKTPEARVRTAVESLRVVDARILGCVLTMQPTKKETGYYYYYGEDDRSTSTGATNLGRRPHRIRGSRPASGPTYVPASPEAPAPAASPTSPAVRSPRSTPVSEQATVAAEMPHQPPVTPSEPDTATSDSPTSTSTQAPVTPADPASDAEWIASLRVRSPR